MYPSKTQEMVTSTDARSPFQFSQRILPKQSAAFYDQLGLDPDRTLVAHGHSFVSLELALLCSRVQYYPQGCYSVAESRITWQILVKGGSY